MAITNNDRQRAYRRNRRNEYARKIDCYVSEEAHLALKRLAKHKGKSQAAFLDWLLIDTEKVVLDVLTDDQLDEYMTRVLPDSAT